MNTWFSKSLYLESFSIVFYAKLIIKKFVLVLIANLFTEEKNKKQNLSQESKIRPNFIQSKCKISIH